MGAAGLTLFPVAQLQELDSLLKGPGPALCLDNGCVTREDWYVRVSVGTWRETSGAWAYLGVRVLSWGEVGAPALGRGVVEMDGHLKGTETGGVVRGPRRPWHHVAHASLLLSRISQKYLIFKKSGAQISLLLPKGLGLLFEGDMLGKGWWRKGRADEQNGRIGGGQGKKKGPVPRAGWSTRNHVGEAL